MITGMAVVAALVVASVVPIARPVVLVVFVAGFVVAPRADPRAWAFAAGVPVAIILTWAWIVGSEIRADLLECADVFSGIGLRRLAAASVVIGVTALLARRLGVSVGSLGLRRPTRVEVTAGILAIALIPIPGLYLGSIVAEPFFGSIRLHLAEPVSIVPALILAIANGSMEELAYRGALLSWGTRVMGPTAALIGQALVFGAAHTGVDYVDLLAVVPAVLAIAAGGLVAGLIVRRTGSLWIPIVVHICFDIPLFYAAACRLA